MPTEADTCREYVLPRLTAAGWTDTQIAEQRTFTAGCILVNGRAAQRAKAKRADYLLYYKPSYPLAVVEAKAAYRSASDGMQQAKSYAETLGLLFAYATNGLSILEFDFSTGIERAIDAFPAPADLWRRYCAAKGLPEELENKLLVANYSLDKTPRYYQQIAINRAVEAILTGQRRVLLTLATGTGKTVIAFQIAWKLWTASWNTRNLPGRRPRILFLADRSILVDDPKDKTFAPFGDARYKIAGVANKSREMYFATYQAIASDESRPGLYRDYAPDFFDLIIVDEAHRGSARDDSSWRDILEYYSGAVQLGMTATPLRDDNRDTYDYFGAPVYTYSLRQGIQDGFLAPYQVRRVVIDVDVEGFRPFAGQRDDYGREIPDREYTGRDFERILALTERTEAVAHHLTNYLKATDRYAKTIVFCHDQDHADRMRRALSNANADLVRQHPNYVVRITSDEHEIGRGFLSKFQDLEQEYPVIVTTSKLLTTGVDAPMVKNVVLFRHIGSMTEFKQIIGRGTRVQEDYGKLYFTILDYTGAATSKFADPAFDGEPVRATEETANAEGEVETTTEDEVPPQVDDADDEPQIIIEPPRIIDPGRVNERPAKYVVSDMTVEIIHEIVHELDASGRRLRTVQLTDYTGEQVRHLTRDATDRRSQWAQTQRRQSIIQALEERGVFVDQVAEVMGQADADPFDLLCHLAYGAPLHSRRERADTLRRQQREFFARYAPTARAVLDALLDRYATYGPSELALPDALRVPAIASYGNPIEIAGLFRGAERLRAAITELQTLLYAA